MRLSIADSLARGFANVRANWELVPVLWLKWTVAGLLSTAALLPPLVVLGMDPLEAISGASDPGEWMATLSQWLLRASSEILHPSGALLAALVGTAALWTLGALVSCFFVAGLMGVLVAGDRQAAPGPVQERDWFRTFTLRDLIGWGRLYTWRYFGLACLVLLVGTLWFVLFMGLSGLVALGLRQWGGGAAVGIGCGGALPLLFGLLVLVCGSGLAGADLARQDSGVAVAARRGLTTLGRRLGGVALLYLLLGLLTVVLLLVLFPVSLAVNLLTPGVPWVRTAAGLLLGFVEWGVVAFVNAVLAASLVALVRSETPSGAGL